MTNIKLLMLLQGEEVDVQIGFHRAFESMVTRGSLGSYHAIPYRSKEFTGPDHWARIYSKSLEHIREAGINLLFLQFFHGPNTDPRPFIAEARAQNPDLLVMTSCGDPFGRWLQRPPTSLRHASSVADLTFSTSMGYLADALVRGGARNVVLMPWGVCQERFLDHPSASHALDFELVFIGSDNGGRNPFTPLSHMGRQRQKMVIALEQRYGSRFALFGRGWEGHPTWHGVVPFSEQQAVMHRARVVIGGFPGSYATYYTSDRPYIAMASGVPLLDCSVPGVDRLMEPYQHWIPYDSIESLLRATDATLDRSQTELNAMGTAARTFVLEGHTIAHRAAEMIDIARKLKDTRKTGKRMLAPRLRCFHSKIDPTGEISTAVKNWHG